MLLVGTPGLKTTSSTWSSSQDGTSPASSLTTASPLSASASFGQSMNSLRSFKTTSAPRAARKRDAATPLRPAPTTRTFLPSSSINNSGASVEGVPREKYLRRPALLVDDEVNALPALQRLEQLVAPLDHLPGRPVRPEEFEQLLPRQRRDCAVVRRVGHPLHVEDRARAVGVGL